MDTPRKILLAVALAAGAFGIGAGVAGAQTDSTEPPAVTEETPSTTDEAPSTTEDDAATEEECDERGGSRESADAGSDTGAAQSASFSRL